MSGFVCAPTPVPLAAKPDINKAVRNPKNTDIGAVCAQLDAATVSSKDDMMFRTSAPVTASLALSLLLPSAALAQGSSPSSGVRTSCGKEEACWHAHDASV